jgi:hypothetical protein
MSLPGASLQIVPPGLRCFLLTVFEKTGAIKFAPMPLPPASWRPLRLLFRTLWLSQYQFGFLFGQRTAHRREKRCSCSCSSIPLCLGIQTSNIASLTAWVRTYSRNFSGSSNASASKSSDDSNSCRDRRTDGSSSTIQILASGTVS